LTLTAVILNDTRGDNHFGCFRVMRLIEENLARRNIRVLARSLVRNDWEKDRKFLSAMSRSDLILINGEGTLHHGAPQGERLLKVVDHPARGTKPVALINALYQENPAEWRRYLDKMTVISLRDSWSAESVRQQVQREVGFVPDLSLSEGFVEARQPADRNLLLIGDSVSRETTKALFEIAASRSDARLLPIMKTIKSSKPAFPPPLRLLREGYIRAHAAAFGLKQGNVLFNRSETGFIDDLLRGYLHVTGRFHSACFCLFTRTPFLAVDSNSWKIEALLNDFGLPKDRLVGAGALGQIEFNQRTAPFSSSEVVAISEGIAACQSKASQLFDDIAELAKGR
jgi:hypothetical protein